MHMADADMQCASKNLCMIMESAVFSPTFESFCWYFFQSIIGREVRVRKLVREVQYVHGCDYEGEEGNRREWKMEAGGRSKTDTCIFNDVA